MISAVSGNMAVHHAVTARLRTNAQKTAAIPAVSSDLAQARATARTEVLGADRPQALTPQYVGAARAAARSAALGEQELLSLTLETYYRDLASGLHAGPKPASAMAAENRYLESRGIIG